MRMDDPQQNLMIMGAIAFAMIAIVAAIRVRSYLAQRQEPPAVSGPFSVENTPQYRKYVLASVSCATQHGWDHHIRPIISTMICHRPDDDTITHENVRILLRRLLGDELFPHVDPLSEKCLDPSAPGPGDEILARVVEAIESGSNGTPLMSNNNNSDINKPAAA